MTTVKKCAVDGSKFCANYHGVDLCIHCYRIAIRHKLSTKEILTTYTKVTK